MDVLESEFMLLKAIKCSNEVKDKEFIVKQMRDIIIKVGASDLV